MKYFSKPLFWLGVVLTAIGFLLWIVFTIINITVVNANANLDFPTGIGLLGIISVIFSLILPKFANKCGKNCDKKIDDE